jgi:hypothetical protein
LHDLQSAAKSTSEGLAVRPKTEWNPGIIALWLIAAILATLIVCSKKQPALEPPAETIEVEAVE